MSVDQIELWHKRARPKPTEGDFNVQLGCDSEIGTLWRAYKIANKLE
jgi:hypothetical protein